MNIDIITGPKELFKGNKSIKDYFPDLVGGPLVWNSQLNRAGGFANNQQVGVQVQIRTMVSASGSLCSFSQYVTIKERTINGQKQPGLNMRIDDLASSRAQGRDTTKPPFIQYIDGNPSIADVPGVARVPNSTDTREFETCIMSGGPGKNLCKFQKCCITWTYISKINNQNMPRASVYKGIKTCK